MRLYFYIYYIFMSLCLADNSAPTDEETYMLELLNRLRAEPMSEVELMLKEDFIPSYVDIDLFKKEMKELEPAQPLFFDRRIIEAARNHTSYQILNGQCHEEDPQKKGFTGVNVRDRMIHTNFKAQQLSAGENVFLFSRDPWFGHIAFTIDWGKDGEGGMQDGRGHRLNNLSSSYNLIGIGILPHEQYIAITQNFAAARGRYLGGVAYEDKNKNNLYDIGEGLQNVKFSINKLESLSWKSGAYTLMVDEASAKVTAQWGELHMATILPAGSKNFKFDFNSSLAQKEALTFTDIFRNDKHRNGSLKKFFLEHQDHIIKDSKEINEILSYCKEVISDVNSKKNERTDSKEVFLSISKTIESKLDRVEKISVVQPVKGYAMLLNISNAVNSNHALAIRVNQLLNREKNALIHELAKIFNNSPSMTSHELNNALDAYKENHFSPEVYLEIEALRNSKKN
jgi:hypothetical protein